MRSHYLHRVLQGKERAPLDEAVLGDPSYLDTSRDAMQIEQYLEWFARAQLLVITAEALRRDRLDTLRRVCSGSAGGREPTADHPAGARAATVAAWPVTPPPVGRFLQFPSG